MTVKGDGTSETRVVEQTLQPRGGGSAGGEKVALQGNGWRLKGVIGGSEAKPAERAVPRGATLIFTAALGLAVGFVNDSGIPLDVTLALCLDEMPDGATSIYGGSIAGSVLDGDSDGTGGAASHSADHPIYELRVRSADCDVVSPGTVATADTLYDDPQSFAVPGSFQGANIGEHFFGSPIPSQAGPDMSNGFEMLVRFSITSGDFVGFTASGVVDGELAAVAPGGASAPLVRGSAPSARAALVPRGLPTPAPATGPVYILGIADGDTTISDSPPFPTPTPTPVATPFSKSVTLPVVFPIATPSRNGGIVLGSVTDFSGGTCTVRTQSGFPLYSASIDGTRRFSLYDDPSSFTATGYRSNVIAPQSFGAPIPSAAGISVGMNLSLDLDYEFLNDCMASFLAIYVVAACADPSYDVDGNGLVTALTDGLIILRYLAGFSGTTLVSGALGSGATRTDPAAIKAFLDCLASTMLDVDANANLGAVTDGVLIVRRLFGFSGPTLVNGALGENAMRTDPAVITTFTNQFIP